MQTSLFGERRALGESHANRGMAFETALNWQHAQYEAQKVAQVHKEYLPTQPVKDAKWARVIGKATVDYVGQLAGGRFVAFDAKDNAGKRIELERLQAHQLRFLEITEALGGLAFVLVRFERARVYVIPVKAWKWANEAHRAGHEVYVEEIDWMATGKASINEKEMKAEWAVEGMDWAATVRGFRALDMDTDVIEGNVRRNENQCLTGTNLRRTSTPWLLSTAGGKTRRTTTLTRKSR